MPGIDSYTKLMLHCDGTDASTTFTDSEITPKTVTANGDAQIDTAQSKFGTASGLFDGTGDYLTVPDDADWNFGSGDFTIDFWVRYSDLTGHQTLVYQNTDSNNSFEIYTQGGTSLRATSFVGGVQQFSIIAADAGIVINTWFHFALVRNGNIFTFFRDGVSKGTDTQSITIGDYNGPLNIGRDANAGSNYFFGWIDELRISKGIARWAGNFTPPTAAYDSNSYIFGNMLQVFH